MNARLIKYALQELKFVTSPGSMKVIGDKIWYLLPRLAGLRSLQSIKTPWSLQLEPTNLCNLSCISCPSGRSKRKKGMMDFELFRKIADDAGKAGVKRIHLYLHGEPFLHPEIMEMIKYLVVKKLPVHVTTNGMFLTEEKSRELLDTGVTPADHILFSVLGYSKEIHELVMKGVKNEVVVANILKLVELRSEMNANGPIVETIFYTMPENRSDKKKYLDFWDGKVDHVRIFDQISNSFAAYKSGDEAGAARKRICLNIWERMTICWNGDVTLCSCDLDGDYVVGNLRESTLEQVWNSPRLVTYRSLHKNKRYGEIPLCACCDS